MTRSPLEPPLFAVTAWSSMLLELFNVTGLMRSQTLEGIPQGRVASVAADLGEFVVPTRRQTRQQAGKN